MELNKIINHLNKILDIKNIDDLSANGLQVGKNKPVTKIGFSVDATIDSIQKANENKCDLLIVHHGISYNNSLKYITDLNYKKIEFLIKKNIALASYHLPLDAHKQFGHNIQIAKLLRLKKIKQFNIGVKGSLPKKMSVSQLSEFLNNSLNTKCIPHSYNNKPIETVTIVSGGGSSLSNVAINISDCFITGEVRYDNVVYAKDMKKNIIEAGHYETEFLGLKALMKYIQKKFNVEVVFID